MSVPVRTDEIARFDGFGRLPEPHLERLAAIARRTKAPAGTVLMREGDDAGDVYIVLDGAVDLSLEGATQVFSTLAPGDLLGWSALLGGGARVATATAATEVDLVVIAGEPLRRLCVADPAVGYAVMRAAFACVAHRLSAARRALVSTVAAR